MERWRKPVIPIAIEEEPSQVVTIDIATGEQERRIYRDYQLVLSDEDVERLRQGYVCINCQEPFEKPFPVTCSLCGFAVREEQPLVFARSYRGSEPAQVSLRDKIAALDEAEERKAHVSGSKIWLPRGVDP